MYVCMYVCVCVCVCVCVRVQGLVDLDDPITKHIDPFLMRTNGTRLRDHFEADIEDVRAQH